MTRTGDRGSSWTPVEGKPIGKVNFVLQGTRWTACGSPSRRGIANWIRCVVAPTSTTAISFDSDDVGSAHRSRMVSISPTRSASTRMEEYLYVVETTGGRITPLPRRFPGGASRPRGLRTFAAWARRVPRRHCLRSLRQSLGYDGLFRQAFRSSRLRGDLVILLDEADPAKVRALDARLFSRSA